MEASKSSAGFLLLLGVVIGLVSYSEAYVFYVGGRDGWGMNPSEDYGRWAGRNRFQVNDTVGMDLSRSFSCHIFILITVDLVLIIFGLVG